MGYFYIAPTGEMNIQQCIVRKTSGSTLIINDGTLFIMNSELAKEGTGTVLIINHGLIVMDSCKLYSGFVIENYGSVVMIQPTFYFKFVLEGNYSFPDFDEFFEMVLPFDDPLCFGVEEPSYTHAVNSVDICEQNCLNNSFGLNCSGYTTKLELEGITCGYCLEDTCSFNCSDVFYFRKIVLTLNYTYVGAPCLDETNSVSVGSVFSDVGILQNCMQFCDWDETCGMFHYNELLSECRLFGYEVVFASNPTQSPCPNPSPYDFYVEFRNTDRTRIADAQPVGLPLVTYENRDYDMCGHLCDRTATCVVSFVDASKDCKLYADARYAIGPSDPSAFFFIELDGIPYGQKTYAEFRNISLLDDAVPTFVYNNSVLTRNKQRITRASDCEEFCDDDATCFAFVFDRVAVECNYYSMADLYGHLSQLEVNGNQDLYMGYETYDYNEESFGSETTEEPVNTLSHSVFGVLLRGCKALCDFDMNCIGFEYDESTEQATTELFYVNGASCNMYSYLETGSYYVGSTFRSNQDRTRYILANSTFDSFVIPDTLSTKVQRDRECALLCDVHTRCVAFTFDGVCELLSRVALLEESSSSQVFVGLSDPYRDSMLKIKDDSTLEHGCIVPVQDAQAVGCYNNYFGTWSTALITDFEDTGGTTPQRCQDYCQTQGHEYYGVQTMTTLSAMLTPTPPPTPQNYYGGYYNEAPTLQPTFYVPTNCYCSDEPPLDIYIENNTDPMVCPEDEVECSGDPGQTCGSLHYVRVGMVSLPVTYDNVALCKRDCFEKDNCVALTYNTSTDECIFHSNADFENCPSFEPTRESHIETLEHYYLAPEEEQVDGIVIVLVQTTETVNDCRRLCDYHDECKTIELLTNETQGNCVLYGGEKGILASNETLFNAREVYLFTLVAGWCTSDVALMSMTNIFSVHECMVLCEHHTECYDMWYSETTMECELFESTVAIIKQESCSRSNGSLYSSYKDFEDRINRMAFLSQEFCADAGRATVISSQLTALSDFECETSCKSNPTCAMYTFEPNELYNTCVLYSDAVLVTCSSQFTARIAYQKKFSRTEQNVCISSNASEVARFASKTKEECATICDILLECRTFQIDSMSGLCTLYDTNVLERCDDTTRPAEQELYASYTESSSLRLHEGFCFDLAESSAFNSIPDSTIELCQAICNALDDCSGIRYDISTRVCTAMNSVVVSNTCPVSAEESYLTYSDIVDPNRQRFKYSDSSNCFPVDAGIVKIGVIDSGDCECECSKDSTCFAYQFDESPFSDPCTLFTTDTFPPSTTVCAVGTTSNFKLLSNPYKVLTNVCLRNYLSFVYPNVTDYECMALCNAKPDCRYFVHGSRENLDLGFEEEICKLFGAQPEELNNCETGDPPTDINVTAYVNGRTFLDVQSSFGELEKDFAIFPDLSYQDCASLCDQFDVCVGFIHTWDYRRFSEADDTRIFERSRIVNSADESQYYGIKGGVGDMTTDVLTPEPWKKIYTIPVDIDRNVYRLGVGSSFNAEKVCIYGLDLESLYTDAKLRNITVSYDDTPVLNSLHSYGPFHITLPCDDAGNVIGDLPNYFSGVNSNFVQDYLISDFRLDYASDSESEFDLVFDETDTCVDIGASGEIIMNPGVPCATKWSWASESIQLRVTSSVSKNKCLGVYRDFDLLRIVDCSVDWRSEMTYVFATQHIIIYDDSGSPRCLTDDSWSSVRVLTCGTSDEFRWRLLSDSVFPTKIFNVATGFALSSSNLNAFIPFVQSSLSSNHLELIRLTECKLNSREATKVIKLEASTLPGLCVSTTGNGLVDCESTNAAHFSFNYDSTISRLEFIDGDGGDECLGRDIDDITVLQRVSCRNPSGGRNFYASWFITGDPWNPDSFVWVDPLKEDSLSCFGYEGPGNLVDKLLSWQTGTPDTYTTANELRDLLVREMIKPTGKIVHLLENCTESDIGTSTSLKSFKWKAYEGRQIMSIKPDVGPIPIPDEFTLRLELWESSYTAQRARNLIASLDSFDQKVDGALTSLLSLAKAGDQATQAINSVMLPLQNGVDTFEDVESSFNTYSKIIKLLERLPYIGIIIRAIGIKHVCTLIENSVKPGTRSIEKIQDSIQTIVTPIEEASATLWSAYLSITESVDRVRKIADAVIDATLGSFLDGSAWVTTGEKLMNEIKSFVKSAGFLLREIDLSFKPLMDVHRTFERNVRKPLREFMKNLAPLKWIARKFSFLKAIWEFKLCIPIPSFRWYWWCFRVWIFKICIPLPSFSFNSKSCVGLESVGNILATVDRIIRSIPGVGFVMDLIEDVVVAIVKGIFKKLPFRVPNFSVDTSFVDNLKSAALDAAEKVKSVTEKFENLGAGLITQMLPELPEDFKEVYEEVQDIINTATELVDSDISPILDKLGNISFNEIPIPEVNLEEITESMENLTTNVINMLSEIECSEYAVFQVPNVIFEGAGGFPLEMCKTFSFLPGFDLTEVYAPIRESISRLMASEEGRRQLGVSDADLGRIPWLGGPGEMNFHFILNSFLTDLAPGIARSDKWKKLYETLSKSKGIAYLVRPLGALRPSKKWWDNVSKGDLCLPYKFYANLRGAFFKSKAYFNEDGKLKEEISGIYQVQPCLKFHIVLDVVVPVDGVDKVPDYGVSISVETGVSFKVSIARDLVRTMPTVQNAYLDEANPPAVVVPLFEETNDKEQLENSIFLGMLMHCFVRVKLQPVRPSFSLRVQINTNSVAMAYVNFYKCIEKRSFRWTLKYYSKCLVRLKAGVRNIPGKAWAEFEDAYQKIVIEEIEAFESEFENGATRLNYGTWLHQCSQEKQVVIPSSETGFLSTLRGMIPRLMNLARVTDKEVFKEGQRVSDNQDGPGLDQTVRDWFFKRFSISFGERCQALLSNVGEVVTRREDGGFDSTKVNIRAGFNIGGGYKDSGSSGSIAPNILPFSSGDGVTARVDTDNLRVAFGVSTDIGDLRLVSVGFGVGAATTLLRNGIVGASCLAYEVKPKLCTENSLSTLFAIRSFEVFFVSKFPFTSDRYVAEAVELCLINTETNGTGFNESDVNVTGIINVTKIEVDNAPNGTGVNTTNGTEVIIPDPINARLLAWRDSRMLMKAKQTPARKLQEAITSGIECLPDQGTALQLCVETIGEARDFSARVNFVGGNSANVNFDSFESNDATRCVNFNPVQDLEFEDLKTEIKSVSIFICHYIGNRRGCLKEMTVSSVTVRHLEFDVTLLTTTCDTAITIYLPSTLTSYTVKNVITIVGNDCVDSDVVDKGDRLVESDSLYLNEQLVNAQGSVTFAAGRVTFKNSYAIGYWDALPLSDGFYISQCFLLIYECTLYFVYPDLTKTSLGDLSSLLCIIDLNSQEFEDPFITWPSQLNITAV